MKDVFCRIIDGEIPGSIVYEDSDVLAILDISQITKGHTLVMPKKHYDSFATCPKDLLDKVMNVAQRIAQADMRVLGASGVNILTNIGEAAGQSVPHFHVHVIPRYNENDGFLLTMKSQNIDSIDLPRLAQKIGDNIE